MSAGVQTKVQANPAQSFTPAWTGLLQRKCSLCNTPGLVEDSERDEELILQRSPVDRAEPSAVPPIVHEVLQSPGQPLDPETRAFMEPRFGHDFSKVRVQTDLPKKIQTKLIFSKPNEQYEREVDTSELPIRCSPQSNVARNSGTPEIPNGNGMPLPKDVRAVMEHRFGLDFSSVRVHSDAPAGQAAMDLGAKAFTQGWDVYFAPGYYNPRSVGGLGLIVHELTHVVQQRSGRLFSTSCPSGNIGTYSSLEKEAEVAEKSLQIPDSPFQVDQTADERLVQYSISETLAAIRTAASGGIQSVAEWVVQQAVATDPLIPRLHRMLVAVQHITHPLIFQPSAVANMGRLYQTLRTVAPRWLPVPELNFTPVIQRNPVIVIGGIAISVAELLLLLAFLIAILWLLGRADPETRRQQDQASEEFLEYVLEAVRRRPTPTPPPIPLGPTIAPEEPRRRVPEPCCCCIRSITIRDIERVVTPPGVQVTPLGNFPTSPTTGHRFNVEIVVDYSGNGDPQTCQLQWFETTNIPYIPGTFADREHNIYPLRPSSFRAWNAHEPPCPAIVVVSSTIMESDYPHMPMYTGEDESRYINFRIRTNSGRGCNCDYPFLQVRTRQLLVVQGGRPDWVRSEDPSPASAP
jgi:hypothetical protein